MGSELQPGVMRAQKREMQSIEAAVNEDDSSFFCILDFSKILIRLLRY
jgi:hypothetical protein